MKLHLIGLFHTLCNQDYSHCAFTGKVFRFAKMMQMRGYEVVEYANESTSECKQKVNILSKEEVDSLSQRKGDTDFHGNDATTTSPLYSAFHLKLVKELASRYNPNEDIVCHPFGHCHAELENLGGYHLETGIGYPTTHFPLRVYESYAWLHYHQGKANRGGEFYEWVIPNYFDVEEWTPSFSPGKYLLYFGRIDGCKGLKIVQEIAERTKQLVVICGQGDPTAYLGPNVKYLPPITGKDRSKLLRNATAMLMPTLFTEPFGGAGVEGMLCGTPLLAHDFGAFTETIHNGFNGYRCRTLGDWMEAIRLAPLLNRENIAFHARQQYSLETCSRSYDRVLQQINDLRDTSATGGWYTKTPRNIP